MNPIIGNTRITTLRKAIGKSDVLAMFLAFMSIIAALYFYSLCRSRWVLLFGGLSFLATLLLWALHRRNHFSIEQLACRVFPAVIAILGISYMLYFPAGSVPDEVFHFKNAYMYSNIISGQDKFTVRDVDYAFLTEGSALTTSISREHWEDLSSEFSRFADNRSTSIRDNAFCWTNNPDSEERDYLSLSPAQLEIPAAAGILIGRVIGLGTIPLFYFGRLFNLLYGLVLIVLAIRITPIAKKTFMVIALLPMTLHLLGSYSYDVGIIGLSFLLIALLIKAILETGSISKYLCGAILVVSIVLAPCKVVYSIISFAVFLIPNRRFSSSRNALLFKIATVVLPFVGIALLSLPTITGMASSSRSVVYTQDGRVGYYYTLSELLSSPLNTAQLFLTTMRVNLWFYLSSAVGGILGWFQGTIGLSVNATDFLLLLVLVSSLQSNDDSQVLRLSHRVYLGCIFLLGVGALVFVFAIAWTLNTSSVIEGVQGRYFLPIILFALLAIRPEMIKIQANVTMPLIMILTSFSYLYLGYIATCVLCL